MGPYILGYVIPSYYHIFQYMSPPKAFIILLNWNNWHETQECLESLEKLDYVNAEIVIVDNGSTNGDAEKIRQFCLTLKPYILKPLFNDVNLGFAGGNNVGIKYALEHGADYVMLLNNDAVAAPDFLTNLVQAAERDASFGILGSRIYQYGTGEIAFEGGAVNKWLNKAEHIVSKSEIRNSKFETNSKHKIQNTKFLVDYITGAAMLVRREVIEKIGRMREEYFLYHEDVDWCLRARKAGYKCVLVPASKVWHKVSVTTKEGSPSYIYYHTRNALMLAKFNGNIIQKAAAYLIGAWILLKQIPKFLFMPSKRIWATSMTRGVLDFYRGKSGKYDSK